VLYKKNNESNSPMNCHAEMFMVREAKRCRHSMLGSMVFSVYPKSEFLNTLKCNLAESASTGFQFNCFDIFNDKTYN
jgi:hypothetical protein